MYRSHIQTVRDREAGLAFCGYTKGATASAVHYIPAEGAKAKDLDVCGFAAERGWRWSPLSDAIYIHQKNDVAVLSQDHLELWEHQSTQNGNMPLRGLLYFAREIEGILAARGVDRYGSRVVKIPAPDHYVFYNGRTTAPERLDLHLSDAFCVPREGCEWTAHVLNINQGYNKELLDACPPLKGYASLIGYIREHQREGCGLSDAVDHGIDRCIKEGVLKGYLLRKKGEVKRMLLTEFDEERFVRTMKEEGREEGREEEGERMGRLILRLTAEKRFRDLERAAIDRTFKEELYARYGL